MPPNALSIISELAALQGLALVADVERIFVQLRQPLEAYNEIEFRSDGKRIDLITLSSDPAVATLFFQLAQARGIAEQGLLLPRALVRFGAGKVVGFKVTIAGPDAGGEIYIRGAQAQPKLKAFLEQHHVAAEAVIQQAAVGEVFGKSHIHMLATDLGPQAQLTVFFTRYLTTDTGDDEQVMRQACEVVGISPAGISAFLPFHRLLSAKRPKTLFCSLGVGATAGKRLKFDYADVRVGLLAELLAAGDMAPSANVLRAWAQLLKLTKADYAGVVVGTEGPAGVRAYFTRRLPLEPALG